MRIITWNCNGHFADNYLTLIRRYNPDLLIITECENPLTSKDKTYRDFAGKNNYQWTGQYQNNGLAVFSKKAITLTPLTLPAAGHENILTININGQLDLIAACLTDPKNDNLIDYLTLNEQNITPNTIITCDLTPAPAPDTTPTPDTIPSVKTPIDILTHLQTKALTSAYHHYTNQEPGKETIPTCYLNRDLTRPLHTDYIFLAPDRLKWLEIGRTSEWINKTNPHGSDHLPLVIDIDTEQ
ncbi:MAG TPA: hypothetical protein O0X39_00010 [Methanocorpusculum sp.]|nr:hypothetical protein [Methanocorpusculum sp.]